MGPRLFSRGNFLPFALDFDQLSSRFNGATTFQPWKRPAGPTLADAGNRLQWGHDFSAVETSTRAGMKWHKMPLQWGHDFSAVETICALCISLCSSSGFNGATTFQPWKHRMLCKGTGMNDNGFNGATTFQPWKRTLPFRAYLAIRGLQWGHDFSAVETRCKGHVNFVGRRASMGPRLFSRGNDPDDEGFEAIEVASMGPRLFSRGNCSAAFTRNHTSAASMGPRLFSRGNDCSRKSICSIIRGFNGATTFQPWKLFSIWRILFGQIASMGPRLFSRGNCIRSRIELGEHLKASMGPRLFSRGNSRCPTSPAAKY